MTNVQKQSFMQYTFGDHTLQQRENEQFAHIEFQNRYNLLRILVPVIAILSILALPGAIYTDINSTDGVRGIFSVSSSTFQVCIVFVGITIAFIAFRRNKVMTASLATFFGVSALILLMILNDTVFARSLSLGTVPEFALLLVPIVLASLLGGPILIGLTTFCSISLTIILFTFAHHDSAYIAFQQTNANGFVLYTVPIGLQAATGIFIFSLLSSSRHAQVQLSTVRTAYERERELDQLKNQFIININHELRTPLMALQGYLMLAREFGHVGHIEQQEHMFELGLESMRHVNRLVESILEVRHIETDVTSLKMTSIDLYTSVTKALSMVDSQLTSGERAVHLHIPAHLQVYADENHLSQILINLITNACKYSPPGSPIEIAAQSLSQAGTGRQATPTPPMVEITVKDYGLGIPPDQIGLLFQRFVRLERDIASKISGTGLGLAICRAYVEAMGGSIRADSSGISGEGTTFSFTLMSDIPA
jgi:signal transduction histidine kinase